MCDNSAYFKMLEEKKKRTKETVHIVVLAALLLSLDVSAYVISKNRIIQVGAGTNQTLNMAAIYSRSAPLLVNVSSLTINKAQIESIRDCRTMEGGSAYQGVYMDACDWIRNLLGLKTSQYRSRPAFTLEGRAPLGGQLSITFPIWTDGTFRMNLSKYKYEFYRNNSEVFAQTRFTFKCSNDTDTNKTNIFGMSVQEMFKTNKTPDELRIYQK